jgi:carbonic anhydrase
MFMGQDPVVTSLIEGYRCFKRIHFETENTFENLQHGQQPKVFVIACCDSRVDPAIITGCRPGDMFCARNIANLVPPADIDDAHVSTRAALEYAVLALKVKHVIVWGHSQCGGIRACLEPSNSTDTLPSVHSWIKMVQPVKERIVKQYRELSCDEQAHLLEKESLKTSLKNLYSFSWINERVQKNELSLHAWYFNFNTACIQAYQPNEDCFVTLVHDDTRGRV